MKDSEEVIPRYPFQPTLKIGSFEGPLDLLLHLIRQSKMNIYDIQIEPITEQYLNYLRQMKEHRLEVAGDYFVMAATLMNIKSRLLLPQAPEEDEEEPADEGDPREELVQQLLEYQRYQKAAAHLKDRADYRQQEYTRPAMRVPKGLVAAHVEPGVTLGQLQKAFSQVLQRHQLNRPVTETVAAEKVSISQRMNWIMHSVSTSATRFSDLFEDQQTKDNLVTAFLALLELTKHQAVTVYQETLFGPIIVTEGPHGEEFRTKQLSADWRAIIHRWGWGDHARRLGKDYWIYEAGNRGDGGTIDNQI